MSIDPITQEILNGAFSSIAEEMAVVEYRSSYSPIIREMLDFSCGIFDATGRLIAHSEMIPAQLGLMQSSLQQGLAKHHPDGLRRGDVMLTNHPYLGGTHTPDLQVFSPVYAGARLIGYAGSIAHHIDVGGRVPGTESAENTELYQEGLLFPAVLLVERGRRVRPLWQVIEANVRDPYATLGDLAAQISALRRGEQRLLELADRYGVETLCAGIEGLLEQTSERARAEFASWPRTAVEAVGYMDDDGVIRDVPLTIAVRSGPPPTASCTSTSRARPRSRRAASTCRGPRRTPPSTSVSARSAGRPCRRTTGSPATCTCTARRAACCGRGSRPPSRPATSPCSASPTWSSRRSATCCPTAPWQLPTSRSRPSSSRRPTRATAASRS